jgi:hypothetical protein
MNMDKYMSVCSMCMGMSMSMRVSMSMNISVSQRVRVSMNISRNMDMMPKERRAGWGRGVLYGGTTKTVLARGFSSSSVLSQLY